PMPDHHRVLRRFCNVYHGFVRSPDGTFATFEVQGAGTGSQQVTQARSINSTGTVIGSLSIPSSLVMALCGPRTAASSPFDALGAGTGAGQGTYVRDINSGGVITGYDVDSSNVNHGFIRTP